MLGSKSREDLAKFDTYRCLTCDTTIREPPEHSTKQGLMKLSAVFLGT